MKTLWLKGLNKDQQEEVRREFNASSSTRLRLTTLLNEKLTQANSNLRMKSNYENVSWALQQADGIGYERAICEIISLIDSKSVDKASI